MGEGGNSNTLELILQIKEDGAVVLDSIKGKIADVNQASQTASGGGIKGLVSGFTDIYFAGKAVVDGIKMVIDTFDAFISAASEAEQIESRMAFQLGAVGYKYQEIKPFVEDFAESILKTTRYSDEMARQSLGQMMQYTGSVTEGMKGAKLAMDIATQTGQDLGSTTRLVGMAMNGNAEILGRWIPELRDLDSKLGANATSAEKAEYAIKVLNEKFKGSSEKDLETYAGQVKQLKNEYDELKESVGRALMPIAQFVVGVSKTAVGVISAVGGQIKSSFQYAGIISKSPGENPSVTDQDDAKRKAQAQSEAAARQKVHDDEMNLWRKNAKERQDIDLQVARDRWQIESNTVALLDSQEIELKDKARKVGADINAIRETYHLKYLEMIKSEKEAEISSLQSMTSAWKSYYDEKSGKQNEAANLIKGLGLDTTIEKKFQFADVENQFKKIADQAGTLLTKEEFEKLKEAYEKKVKELLPAGGKWEETAAVGSGAETNFNWYTGKGTNTRDYRWVENSPDYDTEKMREASLKRIESMFKGTGAAKDSTAIVSGIDQARDKVWELENTLEDLKKKKLDIDTTNLLKSLKDVDNLTTALQGLSGTPWRIPVEIVGGEWLKNLEKTLQERLDNGRSRMNG